MIIDAHIHAGYGNLLAHSWDTFEDINISLRRMARANIDKAVVLPISTGYFAKANRETAQTVYQHSGSLYGFAKVDQINDKYKITDILDEAFGELNLSGLKLHGHPNQEVMDACKKYKKPRAADRKILTDTSILPRYP